MPRGQDKKKKEVRKISQDESTILRIEPYATLSKRTLLSYVQNDTPVYLPKGVTERKKYKLAEIRKELDADNSELCRRPRYGLSMTASSMSELHRFLHDNEEDVKANIAALKELFHGANGTSFRKALVAMNVKDEETAELDAKEAVAAWWTFMEDEAGDKQKVLRQALMSSSRIYLGGFAMLECLALADRPSEWAEKIDPVDLQLKAVRAWASEPKSASKARKAMEELLKEDSRQKEKKKKRTNLRDASSESSSNRGKRKRRAASSSAASSSSGSSKPRRGRKRKSRSASVSSDDQKKHKKKDSKKKDKLSKKEKDKKKKKRNESSGSSSDSGAAALRQAMKDKQEDDKIAACTLMKQGEVQEANAKVFETLQRIGSAKDGKFPVKELLDLKEPIPADLLQKLQVASLAGIQRLAETGEETVPSVQARKYVVELHHALTWVEDWYEGSTAATAGGSAASVTQQ